VVRLGVGGAWVDGHLSLPHFLPHVLVIIGQGEGFHQKKDVVVLVVLAKPCGHIETN
jgi:hypothetical protein